MITALLSDMFFTVKIKTTADHVGVPIHITGSPEEVQATLILVDLETFSNDLPVLKKNNPESRIVGFLSHVNLEARKTAEAAGIEVQTRSEFTKNLPTLLGSTPL